MKAGPPVETGALLRKESDYISLSASCEDMVRKEPCASQEESSYPELNHLDLGASRTERNKCLLFKPSSL